LHLFIRNRLENKRKIIIVTENKFSRAKMHQHYRDVRSLQQFSHSFAHCRDTVAPRCMHACMFHRTMQRQEEDGSNNTNIKYFRATKEKESFVGGKIFCIPLIKTATTVAQQIRSDVELEEKCLQIHRVYPS
jgi:hypothetical protein